MPRSARLKPHELVPGWPDGPAADPIGEVARLFADNLREALGGRSIRSVAESCGINHSTLIGVLEGRAWPDMETIAKLERGLDAALWPGHAQGGPRNQG
jgi:transcriptional regulator with XRE-family HTH domain